MGYRSDVVSCLAFENDGAKVAFLVTWQNHHKNTVCPMVEMEDLIAFPTVQGRPLIVLQVPGCKWYPEYLEVVAWNELLSFAGDNNVSTIFLRVGEEMNDVEEQIEEAEWAVAASFYLSDIFTVSRSSVTNL